jgi:hypothetical protein
MVPVEAPLWRLNPKPAKHEECHESSLVLTPEKITISFDGQPTEQ